MAFCFFKVGQLKSKSKQLEEVVSTLKEAEEQLRIERDTEIDNLHKQVDSLRKRQEQGQNEQLAHLEEENKKLVKVHACSIFVVQSADCIFRFVA